MASLADRSLGFPRMSPARTMLHDLFSLAICLGGIIMIIFSGISEDLKSALRGDGGDDQQHLQPDGKVDYADFPEHIMVAAGTWALTACV